MKVQNSCLLQSEPGEVVTMLHSGVHASFNEQKPSIAADESALVLSKLNSARVPRSSILASSESIPIWKKDTPIAPVKQEHGVDVAVASSVPAPLRGATAPDSTGAAPTEPEIAGTSPQGNVRFELPSGPPSALSIVAVDGGPPVEPSPVRSHQLSTEEIHKIFMELKREASAVQKRLLVPITGTEAAKLVSALISKIDAQNGPSIEEIIGDGDGPEGPRLSSPHDAIRTVLSEATQRLNQSAKSRSLPPPKKLYKVEKFKATMGQSVSKIRSALKSPDTVPPYHAVSHPASQTASHPASHEEPYTPYTVPYHTAPYHTAPYPPNTASTVPEVIAASQTALAVLAVSSAASSQSTAVSSAVSAQASAPAASIQASATPAAPQEVASLASRLPGSYLYQGSYYGNSAAHDYTPYTTAYPHYPQNAFPQHFAPGSMPVQATPHYSQFMPPPPPGYPVPMAGWSSPLNQLSPGATPNWQQFLAESPSASPSGLFGRSPPLPGMPNFGMQVPPPMQMMREQPGRIQEMHAYQANQTRYPHVLHGEGTKKHVDHVDLWSHKQLKFSNNLVIKCQQCGATSTPEWRRGPEGQRTLCNACGLFHAKIARRQGEAAAVRLLRERRPVCP